MVTINLYKFDELSDSAKQKAIDSARSMCASRMVDCDADEYRNTLKLIEEKFGIDVYDWEVDSCGYRFKFSFDSRADVADDSKYLCRYLRDLFSILRKGKYYSTGGRLVNGKYQYKYRYSKVISEYSCILTGCWCDFAVDDAMKNRFDYIRRGFTIRDFVEDVLDKFFGQWHNDYEYVYSDEAVEEYIEGNDFLFYEDGKIYSK